MRHARTGSSAATAGSAANPPPASASALSSSLPPSRQSSMSPSYMPAPTSGAMVSAAVGDVVDCCDEREGEAATATGGVSERRRRRQRRREREREELGEEGDGEDGPCTAGGGGVFLKRWRRAVFYKNDAISKFSILRVEIF